MAKSDSAEANEEVIGDVDDIKTSLQAMLEDLECAECSETQADLIHNLESAVSHLPWIKDALADILAKAKRT